MGLPRRFVKAIGLEFIRELCFAIDARSRRRSELGPTAASRLSKAERPSKRPHSFLLQLPRPALRETLERTRSRFFGSPQAVEQQTQKRLRARLEFEPPFSRQPRRYHALHRAREHDNRQLYVQLGTK